MMGTSDDSEAQVPEVMGGVHNSASSAAQVKPDLSKAEGSSTGICPEHASLDAEYDARSDSKSAAEASDADGALAHSSSLDKHISTDDAADHAAADQRSSSKQNLLDTEQESSSGDCDKKSDRTEGPEAGSAKPTEESTQPGSSGRPDSATPAKASRRKSQADTRALEREYLEGELDALGEKEQEEVPHLLFECPKIYLSALLCIEVIWSSCMTVAGRIAYPDQNNLEANQTLREKEHPQRQ